MADPLILAFGEGRGKKAAGKKKKPESLSASELRLSVKGARHAAGRAQVRARQMSSGTISIAPHGHSLAQMPQPLQ